MNESKETLFTKIDCFRIYIPDIEKGLEFYSNSLGLKIIWKTETAVGLGMDDDITEIVIQNERKGQEIDIKVNSVINAIETLKAAGGEVVYGPFDIRIGKCAIIKDPWGNQYVILDSSKGTFVTDDDGNVIGQNKPE